MLGPGAQALLAAGIVMMMGSIALGLQPAHFTFLRAKPGSLAGGLAAQFIALPAVTLAIAALLSPPPSIALGMIVVAACPGGNVSNFMSWAARADVAYSVSLTAASSVIAAVWTPAAILFWSTAYPPTAELLEAVAFDRARFVLQTTILLAGPLAAGMTIARFAPDAARRAQKPVAYFGAGLLAFVIIDGFIDFLPLLLPAFAMIMVPVTLQNAAAFATGAVAARALRLPPRQRRALTIEVGIQNAGLAVVLILAQLEGLGGAAAIAAVWGVWHFFSGGLIIAAYRRMDRKAGLS